jgi:hypothetical protein
VSRQCNKQLSACAQLEYWCASEVTRGDTAPHRLHVCRTEYWCASEVSGADTAPHLLHVCRTENSWTFSSYTRRHTDTRLTLRKIEIASEFITISVLLAGSQYWRQDLHTAVTCCVSGYHLLSWALTTLRDRWRTLRTATGEGDTTLHKITVNVCTEESASCADKRRNKLLPYPCQRIRQLPSSMTSNGARSLGTHHVGIIWTRICNCVSNY